MKPILFISDLHLSPERPDIIQLFLKFLDEKQDTAQCLYILGDFVEYWLGDDDKAEGLSSVINHLKAFSENETKVYLMHGNRDFLIGHDFASRCGVELIPEPYQLEINQDRILLMHGDTLCTDDTRYQMFRSMVRNPEWQQDFLSKPLTERIQIAQAMRETSKKETQEKTEAIMDVNQDAVTTAFVEHETRLLIHGHTHRPAIHQLEINNTPAVRIVLGDWYSQGSYLELNDTNSFDLKEFH